MNLWTVFVTGLFTGGLTCLAVQGGLLAATLAQREEEILKGKLEKSGNALPILSFLGAKLLAYTILGFLLGSLGSLLQLSITTNIILQLAVGIFMIGTALNLLEVHPIFRYFVIQPPKFLTRLVRHQTKSRDLFAPAILGAFTVFIPCGTTQAMMALSIASANPILGATIMFTFTLGTSPIFFILGFFATKLGEALQQKFLRLAAYTISILAVFNINNAVALTGSSFTLENLWNEINCTFITICYDPRVAGIQMPVSEATIYIQEYGYNPNNLTLKAGSEATLKFVNTNGRGCTQAFTIPKLGIQKIIPLGATDSIKFKVPEEPQELAFMCGMGMFRGKIRVI